jgi:hypothetical protein
MQAKQAMVENISFVEAIAGEYRRRVSVAMGAALSWAQKPKMHDAFGLVLKL